MGKTEKEMIKELEELLEIKNIDNILNKVERLMKDSWRLEEYREVNKLLAEQVNEYTVKWLEECDLKDKLLARFKKLDLMYGNEQTKRIKAEQKQYELAIEKLEELKESKYTLEVNKSGLTTMVFKNEVNEKIDEMIKELKWE